MRWQWLCFFFFFFSKGGLNKRGPWHHMRHVTLVCYGWEAGYTMYTQCLVGWKRNQKLRVVIALEDPSCPVSCSPTSSCLSLPSIMDLTVLHTTGPTCLYPGAGWSLQQEVLELEQPSEVHPWHGRGKRTRLSPALLTLGLIYQVCFYLFRFSRMRSFSSSNFQVPQTEVTVHRNRQSLLARQTHLRNPLMGNGMNRGSITTQSLLGGPMVETPEPHPPLHGHVSKPAYVGTLIPINPDWVLFIFS